MSVADVPVSELVGLDATCSHCHAILMLCLLLLEDVLHDGLHQWRRGASGDELSVVMALNVFHVLIIGAVGGSAIPAVPLQLASHSSMISIARSTRSSSASKGAI